MTFLELQTDVFQRLAEVQGAPVFWGVADVKEAINEGYAEMSDASEWYERNSTIGLLSNRTYYDLRTNLGGDTILTPGRCFSSVNNTWLLPSSVRELDRHVSFQWEKNISTPRRMFQRGMFHLGVHPKPSGDVGTIKLYYTAMPADLSADSDEPGFYAEHHPGIVDYACYDLLCQDGEIELALGFWKQYLEYEERLVKDVKGRATLDHAGYMS